MRLYTVTLQEAHICRARLTRVTRDVIPKNPSVSEVLSNVHTN